MNQPRALFRKVFDPKAFEHFRRSYENLTPDRSLESAAVSFEDTDPEFRSMVPVDPDSLAFVEQYRPEMGLFLQGPFPMPGRNVVASAWDCRGKAGAYAACGLTRETIVGKRALDVGSNAGYDVFYFSRLGAVQATGLEPHGFFYHALFLNAVYNQPGVAFFNAGWDDLDPHYVGDHDIVSCLGLIYHVREPSHLIDRLAAVMRPGAKLVLESHVLSPPSRQSLFIEDKFWDDATYWWIFGDECLMAMLRAAGFKDVQMRLKGDCDSRNPADPTTTVEGYPAGARAWFTATKA